MTGRRRDPVLFLCIPLKCLPKSPRQGTGKDHIGSGSIGRLCIGTCDLSLKPMKSVSKASGFSWKYRSGGWLGAPLFHTGWREEEFWNRWLLVVVCGAAAVTGSSASLANWFLVAVILRCGWTFWYGLWGGMGDIQLTRRHVNQTERGHQAF